MAASTEDRAGAVLSWSRRLLAALVVAVVWAATGAALDSVMNRSNIGGVFLWLAPMGLVCTAILALLVLSCPRAGRARWRRNLRDGSVTVALGILVGEQVRFALLEPLSPGAVLLGFLSALLLGLPILAVAWLIVDGWLGRRRVLPPPPPPS